MALIDEHLLAKIRQKLQDDGVKLWLPPYHDNGTAVEEKLQVIIFIALFSFFYSSLSHHFIY